MILHLKTAVSAAFYDFYDSIYVVRNVLPAGHPQNLYGMPFSKKLIFAAIKPLPAIILFSIAAEKSCRKKE